MPESGRMVEWEEKWIVAGFSFNECVLDPDTPIFGCLLFGNVLMVEFSVVTFSQGSQ